MSTSSDPRKRPNGGVADGGPDPKRRKEHSSSSSHSHSRPPHSSSSSSSSSHKKTHSSSSHKHKSSASSSSSSHKHKSSSSKSKSPAKKHSRGTHVIPTVETNVTVKKKKSEFLCDIDFRNTLPDPPIHPKLLNLYLSHDRLLRYVGSSLEKEHKFDILTELNLGIPIDLIDLDQYIKPENAQLAIEDIRILPQQRDNKKTFMPTKEQLINQKSSNWLRRADILQNNLYDKGNKQVSMIDFAEAEAVRIARLREETLAYNSREKQIERIIETFDLASTDPVHRTNPSLTPVQILDILPDEAIADNEYCWIRFEADPMSVAADEDESEALANTAAEDAILKSYDENHHGLYIPSDEHIDEAVDEKVLARESYKWIREYVKNPTPAVEPENNFFFIQTENAIYYSTYQLRLHLSKRVKTRTDAAEDEVASRPSTLSLHVMAGEFEEDGGAAQAETAEGEDGEEQTEEQTEEAVADGEGGETADGDAQATEAEAEGEQATMETEQTEEHAAETTEEGGEDAGMETTETAETATGEEATE